MDEPFHTIALGGAILLGFLIASAFTKNKIYSSTLFAIGVILFFIFFLEGCHTIWQGFSNIN